MYKTFLFIAMLMSLSIKSFSVEDENHLQFHNDLNHHSGNKITKVKVCGERCSGTNFIMHLIHRNFPTLAATDFVQFGQKHFLWWFDTPYDESKIQRMQYSPDAFYLTGSEDCLFVVVIRDPYDWLKSFYHNPWEVHDDLLDKDFNHFISNTWKIRSDKTGKNKRRDPYRIYDAIDNFNPYTGNPFANVLELRTCKYKNYLKLGTLVKNYLFVRYEDVNDAPEEFIAFISETYQIEKDKLFQAINTRKGSHIPYVKHFYPSIEPRDLELINQGLDWPMENSFGYFSKDQVQQ